MEGSLLLWCLSPGSEWPGAPGISPSPLSGWGCLPSKNQNCVVLFSWRNLISTWYQPVHLCRRIFSYKKSNYMSFFCHETPCYLPVRRHLFKERHLFEHSGVLPSPFGWQELVGGSTDLVKGPWFLLLLLFHGVGDVTATPLKTHMEPPKLGAWADAIPFSNGAFSVSMLVFGGVIPIAMRIRLLHLPANICF